MKNIILEVLKQIEHDYDVKVLYACESGSRAWGFPSKDSDYDVRFIYVHRKEYYLSIDPVGMGTKRDVIELPINHLLDISGWDITKSLKLFRKCNPALLEWLHSGIVYYQNYQTIEQMKQLQSSIFAQQTCLHHYLNMASHNFREYLQRETIQVKKYFYVLRPILASRWIEQFNEFPPLEFQKLLEKVVPGKLKDEISIIIDLKITGKELDFTPSIRLIQFLQDEIDRLLAYAKSVNIKIPDPTELLNQLFRNTLDEVWN